MAGLEHQLDPPPQTPCPGCGTDVTTVTVGDTCPICERQMAGLCRGCGYELSGLSVGARCPECARPIIDSMRGDLLVFASADYIRTLKRGVTCILTGILFMVFAIIAGIALQIILDQLGPLPNTSAIHFYASMSVGVITTGLSVYGWYLFSSPDPGVTLLDSGDRPRQVLRTSVLLSAAFTLIEYAIEFIDPAAANQSFTSARSGNPLGLAALIVTGIGIVLWAVQFFAAMRYLHWLARRVPDSKLARTAQKYQWLLPVLAIPGFFACGLGTLIALILYYNFLNTFRIRIKAIAAHQSLAPSPM